MKRKKYKNTSIADIFNFVLLSELRDFRVSYDEMDVWFNCSRYLMKMGYMKLEVLIIVPYVLV